ncbi:MAG: hypothetical protein H6R27_1567 [Proteobacteria bacterium]|nr:hypothetical protein [Pseudomonadota bacterium]
MNASKATLTACVAALALLAGCHEPVSVTVYEAGEYKGESDPLLKAHAKSESKEALQKRFSMGQSDR